MENALQFEGQLDGGSTIPILLGRLHRLGAEGELHLDNGDCQKKIFFSGGEIEYCATTIRTERLGAFLLRERKINRHDLSRALKLRGTKLRLGESLIESGCITREELVPSIIVCVKRNIVETFVWTDGRYRFGPLARQLPDDLRFDLTTVDLLLEGVRQLDDMDLVLRGLGDLKLPLRTGEAVAGEGSAAELLPIEGFLLSRVDGHMTVEDICSISTVGREDTCRCLYGLLCVGLIENGSDESIPGIVTTGGTGHGTAAKTPGEAPGLSDERYEFVTSSGEPISVYPESGEQAETGNSPDSSVSEEAVVGKRNREPEYVQTEQTNAEREEILQQYEKYCVIGADHYEILGIPQDANEDQIRQAYYRQAKKFHPDRHHRIYLEDLRDKLEALFMKIGEAHVALSDRKARLEYDDQLKGASRRRSSAETGGDSTAKEVAREQFEQGLRYYEGKDYYNAVEMFRLAIQADNEHTDYHRYLAMALSKNPKWAKQAEESLRRAIELEPFRAELYILLGRLYRKSGLLHRAINQYEEALRHDASSLTARKELEEVRSEVRGDSDSFIKSFFGKKRT